LGSLGAGTRDSRLVTQNSFVKGVCSKVQVEYSLVSLLI
jgi:hypothetical protein